MKAFYLHLFPIIFLAFFSCTEEKQDFKSPNILFVISDDQSFSHTSFSGSSFVDTPAFDRIASEGVYFAHCIAGSPGCAPSRSSIVTGRYPWQNEQSGQHASSWLKKYVPFIDVLGENGYMTGRTGKGVAPFQYASSPKDSLWRTTDAGGIAHSNIRYEDDKEGIEGYAKGVSGLDYFENFKHFIENKKKDQPFFFWFGPSEPHRAYEKGSWKRMGKNLEDVEVPGFLPDNDEIRGDLLDYAVEIEWFDKHLGKMLKYLEDIGELENTIVIVTSDNGKPFPRAKANAYEYGIHVPMAVRYPKAFPGGRVIDAPISFVDIAPTILEIAGASPEGMMPITGESFLKLLTSEGINEKIFSYAYSGRERHSSSRYKNWGYPQRAIRSRDYLYIWNMKPERWPAGAPQKYNPKDTVQLLPINGIGSDGKYIAQSAYTDIDDCPTKTYLLEHGGDSDIQPYLDLAIAKRPEFELYDIRKDPDCLKNLVGKEGFTKVEETLNKALVAELIRTQDPRVVGPKKDVFDTYKRYSPIRSFPKP
ncbi:sulfatase family protein [Echinicola shivajiensis]|uniref:sulfatase family protein n=1 Tax=Echinicola shivajiensis TaxID=1035916 RepID=UPI001BFC8436|nr:sulfatase [Echinicola shivajiensis]